MKFRSQMALVITAINVPFIAAVVMYVCSDGQVSLL